MLAIINKGITGFVPYFLSTNSLRAIEFKTITGNLRLSATIPFDTKPNLVFVLDKEKFIKK